MAILSIDQGTSSTKSIVYSEEGTVLSSSQKEHKQIFLHEAWVEHDPLEILANVKHTMGDALNKAQLSISDIKCIGITNQRETITAWNKNTLVPMYNAIVWQCRRTAGMIEELKSNDYADTFLHKTGLVLDAYFSGTKMKWLLENVPKVSDANHAGELHFGTIDTWIIANLSGEHTTDASNASRTLLLNTASGDWDDDLLEILKIQKECLPEIRENASTTPFGYYRKTSSEIPIRGVLGDQQAALFGQNCLSAGQIKTTYGTGNFSLMNTGGNRQISTKGLLSTIAWQIDDKITYALEGSVFVTGAAMQWLRDNLEILSNYSEIDQIVVNSKSEGNVVFVPAFVGMGAPHWNSSARGAIFGITRATTKGDIVNATLDAIAWQTQELLQVFEKESNLKIDNMKVDGGITQSEVLMQKQADYSKINIERPVNIETTALGVALMAGYKLIWENLDDFTGLNPISKRYEPQLDGVQRMEKLKYWEKAVARVKNWA